MQSEVDFTYLRALQTTSREIPRIDRYRYKISSEICGSDHERRK